MRDDSTCLNRGDSPRNEMRGTSSSAAALITGGAGFIGTNLAIRLLSQGQRVVILDNLSRAGTVRNARHIRKRFGSLVRVIAGDVRDGSTLSDALENVDSIYHFAGQVAVTSSLKSPREDFEMNAGGTLTLLELLRQRSHRPVLFFTSTNKVYGGLEWLLLEEDSSHYFPRDPEIRRRGISELAPLSFQSPYGCSKGTADQYVLDYSRSYGLSAVVLRMSCIYGFHQNGTEDQGWVSHFISQFLEQNTLTIYGDGKQVRDLLFVDDLIDALLLARRHIDRLTGSAFNIGGGPSNSISLINLIAHLNELKVGRPDIRFSDWRVGDQRYYVSDTSRFRQLTEWRPRVDIKLGLDKLTTWLMHRNSNRHSQDLV